MWAERSHTTCKALLLQMCNARAKSQGLSEYMHNGLQKQGLQSSTALCFKGDSMNTAHMLVEIVTLPAPRFKFKHMGDPINPNGGS